LNKIAGRSLLAAYLPC
jgi:hypothetical protein